MYPKDTDSKGRHKLWIVYNNVAYMTNLVCGDNPPVMSYKQSKMRAHLIECLAKGPFPTLIHT